MSLKKSFFISPNEYEITVVKIAVIIMKNSDSRKQVRRELEPLRPDFAIIMNRTPGTLTIQKKKCL